MWSLCFYYSNHGSKALADGVRSRSSLHVLQLNCLFKRHFMDIARVGGFSGHRRVTLMRLRGPPKCCPCRWGAERVLKRSSFEWWESAVNETRLPVTKPFDHITANHPHDSRCCTYLFQEPHRWSRGKSWTWRRKRWRPLRSGWTTASAASPSTFCRCYKLSVNPIKTRRSKRRDAVWRGETVIRWNAAENQGAAKVRIVHSAVRSGC